MEWILSKYPLVSRPSHPYTQMTETKADQSVRLIRYSSPVHGQWSDSGSQFAKGSWNVPLGRTHCLFFTLYNLFFLQTSIVFVKRKLNCFNFPSFFEKRKWCTFVNQLKQFGDNAATGQNRIWFLADVDKKNDTNANKNFLFKPQ